MPGLHNPGPAPTWTVPTTHHEDQGQDNTCELSKYNNGTQSSWQPHTLYRFRVPLDQFLNRPTHSLATKLVNCTLRLLECQARTGPAGLLLLPAPANAAAWRQSGPLPGPCDVFPKAQVNARANGRVKFVEVVVGGT